jgi:phosphohistidine phosphatase
MKTLYLMRHAKSAHGAGPARDHDRPLNERGRSAAVMVGQYMAARKLSPQHILCSDAKRTRETLGLLSPDIVPDVPTELRADLYLASTRTLLTAVRKLPNTATSALVIGHNPGIQNLALSLIGSGKASAINNLEVKFPTAALAVIRFNINQWNKLGLNEGEMLDYVLPRTLANVAD